MMSFLSKLKRQRAELVERRRMEATMAAGMRGAGLEEAKRAGDRAARGNTNAAIAGAAASSAGAGGC
ncbi:hypothetical protein [Streptomyces sp. WZ-12]|uniref:hypothetical protein n=1 Tax=Streptomyces sp. WZ-12 TaxID=3030210 RepID=UPI00238161B1|nr:hypothetical protein [Streptomyces sp. WZ-12]